MSYLFIKKAQIARKLGVKNVARYVIYQAKLRSGYFELILPPGEIPLKELFHEAERNSSFSRGFVETIKESSALLRNGVVTHFFGEEKAVGSPPDWFYFDADFDQLHWSKVPLSRPPGQDIKYVWDLSRFHWAPQFALAYVATGERHYLTLLNDWVADWIEKNRVNCGSNWSCAQEVSIRLINLLNAAFILNQHSHNNEMLEKFVVAHCRRILSTLSYGIAQANNHGISESAALFIGGSWLHCFGGSEAVKKEGKSLQQRGRDLQEQLVAELIQRDGGFSMYSLSYQRVVIATLAVVELWRIITDSKSFSLKWKRSAIKAIEFLTAFVDPQSGDVPNWGTNDGSYLYTYPSSEIRDFRPALQMAAALIDSRRLFNDEKCDQALEWLPITLTTLYTAPVVKKSQLFEESGCAILVPKTNDSWATITFPNYSFRPGHLDPLHFDLWSNGQNIVTDSGSYSYNCDSELENYFVGSIGHNTVQFDDREPMPRLGKFLVSDWLQSEKVSALKEWEMGQSWSACYRDGQGSFHSRQVSHDGKLWIVEDSLANFHSKAVLRWHLADFDWHLSGNELFSTLATIIFSADVEIEDIQLGSSPRSLLYGSFKEAPMLSLTIKRSPATITTRFKLN